MRTYVMTILISLGVLSAPLCVAQSVTASEKRQTAESLGKAMMERERAILDAIAKKDLAKFKAELATDFRGVYPSGIYDVSEEEKTFGQMQLSAYTFSDMHFSLPNPDTLVLTYKLDMKGSVGGQDVSGISFVSSVWIKEKGKWLTLLHTESPAEKTK